MLAVIWQHAVLQSFVFPVVIMPSRQLGSGSIGILLGFANLVLCLVNRISTGVEPHCCVIVDLRLLSFLSHPWPYLGSDPPGKPHQVPHPASTEATG